MLIRVLIIILITTSFSFADFRFSSDGSGSMVITDDGSGVLNEASGGGGSQATLVQEMDNRNTYTSPNTPGSVSVTFGQTATTNNLIFTVVCIDKDSGAITQPSGYTKISEATGGVSSGAIAYKISAGNESSLQWDWANTEEGNAYVVEYSGINSSDPLDVSAEDESNVSTADSSQTTGTTAATDEANELALAIVCTDSGNSIGTNTPRFSWSNGFSSQFEEPVPDESGNPFTTVAVKNLSSTGTVETTGTHSGSDESYGAIATFHLE